MVHLKWICCLSLGLLVLIQCEFSEQEYPRMVGDIAVDKTLDDSSFRPCNETQAKQYHNFGDGFQYKGEKIALKAQFETYNDAQAAQESGLIRIRFMINCKGESGRFRVMGMDKSFNPYDFDSSIMDQLLSITKKLSGWPIRKSKNKPMDYYVYLIFKIENGQLIEIMP